MKSIYRMEYSHANSVSLGANLRNLNPNRKIEYMRMLDGFDPETYVRNMEYLNITCKKLVDKGYKRVPKFL